MLQPGTVAASSGRRAGQGRAARDPARGPATGASSPSRASLTLLLLQPRPVTSRKVRREAKPPGSEEEHVDPSLREGSGVCSGFYPGGGQSWQKAQDMSPCPLCLHLSAALPAAPRSPLRKPLDPWSGRVAGPAVLCPQPGGEHSNVGCRGCRNSLREVKLHMQNSPAVKRWAKVGTWFQTNSFN